MKKLLISVTILLLLLSNRVSLAAFDSASQNPSRHPVEWIDSHGKRHPIELSDSKTNHQGTIRLISEENLTNSLHVVEEALHDAGVFMVVGDDPIKSELQKKLGDHVIPEIRPEDKIIAYGVIKLPSGKNMIAYYISPQDRKPEEMIERLAFSFNEDFIKLSQQEHTIRDSSFDVAQNRDWNYVIDNRYVRFERAPYGDQVALISLLSSRNDRERRHDWLTHVYHELVPGLTLGSDYDGYVNWRQRVDFEVQRSPDGGQPLLTRSAPPSTAQNWTITFSFDPTISWETHDTDIERHPDSNQQIGWLMRYNNQSSPRAEEGHYMEPAAQYQLNTGHRFRIDYYFTGVWGDIFSHRYTDLDRYIGFTVYPSD